MFLPFLDGVLVALALLVSAAIAISVAMLAAASVTRPGQAPHGGIRHDLPPHPQPGTDDAQLGPVPDRQVLAAGVAVVDQHRHLHALPGPVGDRHHQRVQHQAGVVARGGTPPGISRANASITSAVEAVPALVATKVKSTTHSRSDASGAKSQFTRSAGLCWDGSATVIRGLFHPPRRTPRSSSARISHSTVHRAAAMPSRSSRLPRGPGRLTRSATLAA
jgi:hypothetical protein